MLLLGHVGIALGAAQLAEAVRGTLLRRRAGVASRFVDYRFLALGAFLPDLIDKPLGLLILPEVVGTTRSIGHTLAFAAVLLLIGALGYWRSRRLLVLSLAIGCLSHLILDTMWSTPQTLLWPFLGWEFPEGGPQGLTGYLSALWRRPWEQPWVVLSEIAGGLVIGHILFKSWQRRRLRYSLQHEALESPSTTTRREP